MVRRQKKLKEKLKEKNSRRKISGPSVRSSRSVIPSEIQKRRMEEIVRILKRLYPDVRCFLHHESPYQLLVATILSAQCTDERVNLVTPHLFSQFPDAQAMSRAKLSQIEKLIQSTGFYKNKAKSILETSKILVEKYAGEVPRSLEELVALRGVGRKTANVILGNAFGIPGFVVDTHVGRLLRRLGFTRASDPVKIEMEVRDWVDPQDWSNFSLWLISHGRAVCTARRAHCSECQLARYCQKVGVAHVET